MPSRKAQRLMAFSQVSQKKERHPLNKIQGCNLQSWPDSPASDTPYKGMLSTGQLTANLIYCMV